MSKIRTAQKNDFLNVLADWDHRYTHDQQFDRRPLLNATADAGASFSQTALNARLTANLDWEILGTNAADADSDSSTGGGVALSTAGAAADTIAVKPHLDTGLSALSTIDWSTDDKIGFGVKIKTGASIADCTIVAGFLLTIADATDYGQGNDNDAVLFRYNPSSNSGKWQNIVSYSGTDEVRDSNVTVVVSTHYVLELLVDADRYVNFYIDGKLVQRSAVQLTTGIDLIPAVGVHASATGVKTITLRRLVLSKEHND